MGVKTFLDSLYEDVGGLDAIPVNQIAATPAAVSPLLAILQSAKPVATPVAAATTATTAPASAFPSSLAQLSALLAQPTTPTTTTTAAPTTTTTTAATAAANPATTTTAKPATAATPVAPATVVASAVPAPKVDYTSALAQQILGQGLTSKWSGEGLGSAEANAADMAKILAGIGITDLKQFGQITKTIPGYSYETEQGTVNVPEQKVTTYGNKLTGQEVPNTYSERQKGNFFGGTFSGKGNTGYGVQFDAQGNPYFYTQGASSNDLVTLFADDPLLGTIAQLGAAYFGGPAGSAALAAAMGKDPVDILKSAALSYAGNAAGDAVSGMSGVTDVLGKTGTNILANTAKQVVSSGGNVDPVQALLASGLNAGASQLGSEFGIGDLTPAQQKMLSSGITGIVSGLTPEQIAMNVAMAGVTTKPDNKLTSSFGPGTAEEFSAGLIPGYFQPGGEGYLPPEETNPVTVQQEPFNLDDFLSQIEQYKQAAVTPDDIRQIISGQNFATPEDVQTAINSIDIPKGLSEQDVQSIVSQAFADNPGIDIQDVQSIVDSAVSKIPAGISQDELTRSLGATEQNVLAKVGEQGEQFQTLLQQYRDLGMDENDAIRQTIDDLGSSVSGQFEDIGGQLSGLRGDVKTQIDDVNTQITSIADALGTTEEELLAQLGTTKEELAGQISGLRGDVKSQIEDTNTKITDIADALGTTKEELMNQLNVSDAELRDLISGQVSGLRGDVKTQIEDTQTDIANIAEALGTTEEELMQRIADLGTDVGSQVSGLRENFKSDIEDVNTQITDIADALGTTKEELMNQLNVSDEELRSLISGEVSGLRGDIKTQIEDTNTEIANIADALGTTEEELMNRLNLSEEELRNLIGGVGEQTKTALAGQAADTKAQFQNLSAAQQAQAKALADQGTSLTNAINQVQSTSNLNMLMTLLGSQQQPTQQTTMQDPYAHIKLMEDLFGSDIDLTPAGEATAKRK